MTKKERDFLLASIKEYEKKIISIQNGQKVSFSADDCPLCKEYGYWIFGMFACCSHKRPCPVAKYGSYRCSDTPFELICKNWKIKNPRSIKRLRACLMMYDYLWFVYYAEGGK